MIYADYNGSAPVCDEVVDYVCNRLKEGPYANPNAIHHLGQKVKMGMENARAHCAKILGCKPKNIIFNSGSTEGITHVFYSELCKKRDDNRDIIITSGIEHSAVVNCAKHYEEHLGYTSKVVGTLPNGVIDLEQFKAWMDEFGDKVAFVSIMAANNETGVIQPYKEIGKICEEKGAIFLCDTTQYIGKTDFKFNESHMDYAVMSGHKIGALTGCGFIIAKDVSRLQHFVIGGGQEKLKRGGTQNYIGNETLAVALDKFNNSLDKIEALTKKREEFESKLKERYPKLVILGDGAPRLASSTFLSMPGVHGQAVQIELESRDVFVTTSSACSDNEPVTSKVLKSMGVTDDVGRGAVRISIGLCSPLETYDKIYEELCKTYDKLLKIENF